MRHLFPITLAACIVLASRAGAQCHAWDPNFTAASNANLGVFSLVAFGDGSGSALYAGGAFTSIGGVPATGIARWDGSR